LITVGATIKWFGKVEQSDEHTHIHYWFAILFGKAPSKIEGPWN